MSPVPSPVSVVTVTYNSSALIGAFLDSAIRAGVPADRIVVVENNSSDAVLTEAAVSSRGCRFILLEKNLGYGAAMNAGVKLLGADCGHLLLSNPDVLLEPTAVSLLSAWLDSHPETGAVGPKILDPDGTVFPSARLVPSLRNGVGHALFAGIWPSNPWSKRYRADTQYGDTPRHAGWLSGACLLIRKRAFDDLEGFDEGYFMYFEDVDLGYRLSQAGWSNDYNPAAIATHIGGESTRTESSRMLQIHHQSAYRFISKKYPHWYQAPVRLTVRAGLWLRFRLSPRK